MFEIVATNSLFGSLEQHSRPGDLLLQFLTEPGVWKVFKRLVRLYESMCLLHAVSAPTDIECDWHTGPTNNIVGRWEPQYISDHLCDALVIEIICVKWGHTETGDVREVVYHDSMWFSERM